MNFQSIPTAIRTPFAAVEFSNTESSSASSTQLYEMLLVGQKLAAGTQPALTPIRVTSEKQANTLFGSGSMLARMCIKALKANNFSSIYAVALEDNGAGVAAKGGISVTGTATADGTLAVYVGGQLVQVAVSQGDAGAAIATDLASAIGGIADMSATAAVNGVTPTLVDITHKHKGAFGNEMPLSINYGLETTPAGLTVAVTAFSGGTTSPDLSGLWAAVGDKQYRVVVSPYTDAASLTVMTDEMAKRWGPMYTNDGHVFTATNLPSGQAVTQFTSTTPQNSPHLTIFSNAGSPTPAYEAAAVLGAVVCYYSPIDQASPLQTLPLPGILPAPMIDRPLLSERNVMLYSGIATSTVDGNGTVRIERVVTTYKEDGSGNPDDSYLDYETMAILSYLRFDFRAFFGRKYPRHKLASNGVRFAQGQNVMTPGLAKAEVIGLFSNWEDLGLVEDAAQFERDLIVEIDSVNKNRLNFYLPPNLINRLVVLASKIAFRA